MSIFKPDAFFEGVSFIDFNYLKKHNITGILLDIDNTLIDMQRNMPQEIYKWVDDAKRAGFVLLILSNTNKMDKVLPIAEKLDIDYVTFAKKPAKGGFLKAANKLNMKCENIAMIGDQILTDVIGANRVGMYSIYVKPINKKEYWYTAWKRPIEALILKHYGY